MAKSNKKSDRENLYIVMDEDGDNMEAFTEERDAIQQGKDSIEMGNSTEIFVYKLIKVFKLHVTEESF